MTRQHDTRQGYVCSLSEREQQQWRETTGRDLYAAARAIEKRPDGLVLRLPGDDARLEQVTGLLRSERRCCPFLTFDLRVEPEEAGIELRLTAPPEAVSLLHDDVDAQARLAEE